MNCIVKSTSTGKPYRVHVMNANHAPVCGGGYGAKHCNWQEDIGTATCARCLTIINNRNKRAAAMANEAKEAA